MSHPDSIGRSVEELWAEVVPGLLRWRGFKVTPTVEERVTDCSDVDTFRTWALRALGALRAEDIF